MNNNAVFSKAFLVLAFIYFTAIITTTVAANYFFEIGHMYFAGGIFIFPFSFVIGSVIGEVYNYSYQRLVVMISIVFQLFFVLYIKFFISLQPAPFFHDQVSYQVVYSSDIRYFIFAVIGLYFAELVNVYLLAKWKCKEKRSNYMTRAFVCIALSQFGLSMVVNIGAFMGKTDDFLGLLNLSVSNYCLKMLVTSLIIVPSYWLVVHLKRIEGVEFFDVKTKFQPFSPRVNSVYVKPV